MPKTTGLCVGESKKDRGKIIKMVEPKTNSAFCGCQTMRLLHGNMSETCEVLKYNMNPPTACHAVVAMAVSRETNSEFWTPRVIDQILMLGNDLFDLTIDLMDDNKTTFDTNTERLRPQQVRKNFLLRDGKILVHMEMDLYQKGIVNPKESGELSLKSAISRFFASHSYAVIMTDRMIVSVWLECGFFYLFYSQSVNQNGLLTKSDNACLIRFETFMHLYQAIMMNMHVEDESSWFEIRRCDFTLKKVPKVSSIYYFCCIYLKNNYSRELWLRVQTLRQRCSCVNKKINLRKRHDRPNQKCCPSTVLKKIPSLHESDAVRAIRLLKANNACFFVVVLL